MGWGSGERRATQSGGEGKEKGGEREEVGVEGVTEGRD